MAPKFLDLSPANRTFSDSNSSQTKQFKKQDLRQFSSLMSTSAPRTTAVVNTNVTTQLAHINVHVITDSHFTRTLTIAKKAAANSKSPIPLVTFHHQIIPTCIQLIKIAFGTSPRRQDIEFDSFSMCLKLSHIRSVPMIILHFSMAVQVIHTVWEDSVVPSCHIQSHRQPIQCTWCSCQTQVFIAKDSLHRIRQFVVDI